MSQPQYRYQHLTFTNNEPYSRYIQVGRPDPAGMTDREKSSGSTPKTHGSYGPLLFHPKWKSKRKEILIRDNHSCIHCKKGGNLQIHHRQYHFIINQQQFKPPWDYPNHLLITLCDLCHSRGHNKYKVPIINIT